MTSDNLPPSLKRRHLWPEADQQEFMAKHQPLKAAHRIVWIDDAGNEHDDYVEGSKRCQVFEGSNDVRIILPCKSSNYDDIRRNGHQRP